MIEEETVEEFDVEEHVNKSVSAISAAVQQKQETIKRLQVSIIEDRGKLVALQDMLKIYNETLKPEEDTNEG